MYVSIFHKISNIYIYIYYCLLDSKETVWKTLLRDPHSKKQKTQQIVLNPKFLETLNFSKIFLNPKFIETLNFRQKILLNPKFLEESRNDA